jgi:hypothetical protein
LSTQNEKLALFGENSEITTNAASSEDRQGGCLPASDLALFCNP